VRRRLEAWEARLGLPSFQASELQSFQPSRLDEAFTRLHEASRALNAPRPYNG
jgi:hypothetical protein